MGTLDMPRQGDTFKITNEKCYSPYREHIGQLITVDHITDINIFMTVEWYNPRIMYDYVTHHGWKRFVKKLGLVQMFNKQQWEV